MLDDHELSAILGALSGPNAPCLELLLSAIANWHLGQPAMQCLRAAWVQQSASHKADAANDDPYQADQLAEAT